MLLPCLKFNIYDQFYCEHIYVFSTLSLSNILKKHKLEIFDLQNLIHMVDLQDTLLKNNNKIKILKTVKRN